ncbi:6-phosphofructokinase [Clostridium paraputrificum]|uniref:6-phosphofructokinase n=1 Tax=Clostridium paraputrificum TaxID=29363 RepID=UPI00189E8FD8|nr:6-phosphofructokinase [Clostridium paraputrificum]MDB2076403.1 6-phosphofructokinase [Clostridium paraputrificum]MDB2079976.1 6-phosphofructokinase [Clostridium paraputrificum]MDB2084722.1 6-phosphofructokinase [Clostridium paraputrificum]MDB2093336.1 6-phosphofructokinase [Clostridium paraputrificum]MDB2100830.1 6-phosphofructokinase [Clostridium paraputrificum]
MPNCIIAQSGGPTSVINSSVVGLIRANEEFKIFDKVYGGLNGIEGILNKNIIDLSQISSEDIDTFKLTPSSGLGSCRYKMKNIEESTEEYDRLLDILKSLDIKAFFYVGGNDSMDTTAKLGKYAKENGLDINFIGIPKTIDNDLMHTDHTPGFGSAAKFISTAVLETYLDSSVYINNGIFIVETMGRDTGWLAASACTARYNGKPVADFIYLPEKAFNVEDFLCDVRAKFKEQNQVFIVASEGLKTEDGRFLSEMNVISQDNFGHSQLGGVGQHLRQLILDAGITTRVKALELGVLQRCAMHCASQIDIDEAFNAGYEALKYAAEGHNGYMVAIKRENNSPYSTSFFLVEANKIANNVKYFPKEWINEKGNGVTEEAYEYFMPLLNGVPTLYRTNNVPQYKVFTK